MLQVNLAHARARFGVAGTSVATAELFREKARMKDALRAAAPVARHALVGSEAEAFAFATEVGFPLILKPPAGMGARATFRVSAPSELTRVLSGLGVSPVAPVLAEQMLRGSEHSFETITVAAFPGVVHGELPTRLSRGAREPVDPVGLRAAARGGRPVLSARARDGELPPSPPWASRTA